MESFGPIRKKTPVPAKRVYVVKVGAQVKGIVSEDLIQRILSLPDVRTLESGDTTYYVVGSFDAIPEALRRELELRGLGIESTVMAEENGRLVDVTKEVQAERERRKGMGAVDDSREVIERVQLGVSPSQVVEEHIQQCARPGVHPRGGRIDALLYRLLYGRERGCGPQGEDAVARLRRSVPRCIQTR